MSTHQGNSACRITVDRPVADVLRVEAKKVLMFNHEPFEDYLSYYPAKQRELADIYRDATAVIDALGWDPSSARKPDTGFEVPLTSGHVQQLHERRCDLLNTNRDLIDTITHDTRANEPIVTNIRANRHSAEALDHVLNAYSNTITT